MNNIIEFPKAAKDNSRKSNVNMTITRNYKGLTVSINLAKIEKEELINLLLPLPSQQPQVAAEDEKIALVKKYINQ